MPTAHEHFLMLRKQAEDGSMQLALEVFGDLFSNADIFFDEIAFELSGIEINESSDTKLNIVADSPEFLFKNTIPGLTTVRIEAEISLIDNDLGLFALCKLIDSPKPSDFPGIIGDMLTPLDLVNVQNIVLVISTKSVSNITSTAFPEYDDKSVQVKPGFGLAGFIDLKSAPGVGGLITKPLEPLIGEGPYFMLWNMVDGMQVDFSLSLPQDIDIEGLFQLRRPELVIKPMLPIQASIDGLFEIPLPAIPISVDGGFSYTLDGVRGRFNLDNIADDVPAPFGYPGVHLSSLTVFAGISNGVANMGAEGKFYIGPNQPSADSGSTEVAEFGGIRSNEFKFIFDAVPGKITPKFCYLYLERVTIEEYIKALSDQAVSLPSFLDAIFIEQAMFHWCESPMGESKPDGTIAYPIFGLSGIANVFGHRTFAELQVDVAGESKGQLIADPIDIGNGLLRITGNGKGTPEGYKGNVTVSPGGMEFKFSSVGEPAYLSFSTKIVVLGLSGEANGSVTDGGITADVKSDLGGILKNELTVVWDNNDFEVAAAIDARIAGLKISLGNLGTLKLDSALQGDFSASFENEDYSNSMSLSFECFGTRIDLGTISVSIRDLSKIVEELQKFIEEKIIKELTADVLKWLTATINDAIEFAGAKLEEIGEALNNSFNESLENSAKLMKQVGYQAKEVGEALHKGFQSSEQELANALKNAGYLAEEVGEVLRDVLNLPGETAAQLLKTAGYAADEIGRTLRDVFDLGNEQISRILKDIGTGADQVAAVLRDTLKLTVDQAANIMKLAGYSAEATSEALKGIGETVENVGKVLVDVYAIPVDAARKILENIGFPTQNLPPIVLPFIKVPLPPVFVKVPPVFVKVPIHIKHIKIF